MTTETDSTSGEVLVEHHTFCRICEPLCGLIAVTQGERLVDLRPNKDHLLSEGFMCVKGRAMAEVVHDPDRVLQPLRRIGGPGEFEPVSWDEALADISTRLKALVDRDGPDAMAGFLGNPPGFDYSAYMWFDGFQKAIGSRWKYGVNGEDAASRLLATHLLYGSSAMVLMPDLWRTDFVLIIGANPLVSKGSLVSEPRIRDALGGIVTRGGRVVVVDPRRTETARLYEHVPVHAGSDAWLLAGIINVLFEEGLVDERFTTRWTKNIDVLRHAIIDITPQRAAAQCGVPAEVIVDLARSISGARSAVVYGRTGTCTQFFGTLNNFLQDTINILTGNLDSVGGWLFPWGPIDLAKAAERMGLSGYGNVRTRARGLPDVVGLLPSQGFAEDIELEGPGQIRAVCMMGANPVRSSGAGGERLERALDGLELFFSLDIYMNETNRYADYILPVCTMYEREDLPFNFMSLMLRPTLFATKAVIPPQGASRPDWEVLDEIARRMGLGGAYSFSILRRLAKIGLRLKPRTMVDIALRTSSKGDLFGLRRKGISFKKLQAAPNGIRLREDLPTGVIADKLRTADKLIDLAPTVIIEEIQRLKDHVSSELPFRMIGMREIRSHNTWMHNSPRLTPEGRSMGVHMHPDDAASCGVVEGDLVRLASPGQEIVVPVVLSEDMFRGNVALPHGWGHDAGWKRANSLGGRCSNELAGPYEGDMEPLAGMSVLNGIPVSIEAYAPT